MYCCICQDEDDSYQNANYILINKLIEQESNQILKKLPPLNNNSIFDSLILETQISQTTISIEKKINDFFDQITQEIMEKIKYCKIKMIDLSQNLPLHNDQIIKKYNEVSKINELRQYMADESTNFSYKEKQCKLIIEQMQRDKEKNTEQLENLLNDVISIRNKINFEIPNLLKEQILLTIYDIYCFNLSETQFSQKRENQGEKCSFNNNQNIEKLMKLIFTKSNYCSEQFLSSLKDVLLKISPIIIQLQSKDIFQANKKPIDFKQLNEQELEQIRDLATHFQKRKNENNYLENINKSEMIQSISSIISNKLNFIKEDFKDQLKLNLIEAYPLLVSKINNYDIFSDSQQYQTFNNMSMKQLDTILKLLVTTSKILQSNQQKESESYRVFKLIKNKFFEYKRTDLEQLCLQYPIFDIIQPQILYAEDIDFQQMFYSYNNQINFRKNSLNQITIQGNSNQNRSQCVSNIILDRYLKYVFRFAIKDQSYENKFQIGLVRDSQKKQGGDKDLLSCGFKNNLKKITMSDAFGIENKLMGDTLIENSNEQEIELRVSIEEAILEITNYPNYDCKIVIADKYKNNLTTYQNLRLYILLRDQ